MELDHQLVGYGPASAGISAVVNLPRQALPEARYIARVPDTDPDAVGSYPLTKAQARRIAMLAGQPAVPEWLNYFLEPVPLGD